LDGANLRTEESRGARRDAAWARGRFGAKGGPESPRRPGRWDHASSGAVLYGVGGARPSKAGGKKGGKKKKGGGKTTENLGFGPVSEKKKRSARLLSDG